MNPRFAATPRRRQRLGALGAFWLLWSVGLHAQAASPIAAASIPPDAQRCQSEAMEPAFVAWAPAGAGRLASVCEAVLAWGQNASAYEAQRRLQASKLWQQVVCHTQESTVVCALTPRQMVKTVALRGRWPFALFKSDLKRRIALRPGSVIDALPLALTQQRERLLNYLAQEGYIDASVAVDAHPVPSHGVEQALHIEVGVHAKKSLQVRRIEIEGDVPIATERLVRGFFHRGWFGFQGRARPASLPDDIERAQQALQAAGYIGSRIDVHPEPHPEAGAIDLRVRVRAGRRLRLLTPRTAPVSPKAVRALAPFAEAGSVDGASLEQYRQSVERLYQEKGFAEAHVSVHLAPDGPPRAVRVDVEIEPNEKGSVRRIEYVGAPWRVLRAARRRAALAQRHDTRWTKAPWVDAYVRHDADALAAALGAMGYANAKVTPERRVEPASGPSAGQRPLAFVLRYTIELGTQEVVGRLRLLHLPPAIDADLLRQRLRLMPGAPFFADALEQDRQAIALALLEQGYTGAEVDARFTEQAHDAEPSGRRQASVRQMDVSFAIGHQERARFAGLLLSGDWRTRPSTVRHEMRFVLREPMDLTDVGAARRQLRGLNLFYNVSLMPVRPIERDPRTWLHVQLEERDVRSLDGLIGFSSDYRFAIGADWRDGNVLGRAINLHLQARLSDASNVIPHVRIGNQDLLQLDVRAPHPLGLPVAVDAQALYRYQDVREYRERRVGGTLGVERPLLSRSACAYCPDISGRFAYELLETYRDDKNSDGTVVIDGNNAVIGRLAPSIDIDWRDSATDPQRGAHLSVRLEGAHQALAFWSPYLLHRADRFWRTLVAAQAFFPLGHPSVGLPHNRQIGGPLVLALAVNFGGAGPYGPAASPQSVVPPSETFGYGGDLSVRGLQARASTAQLANPPFLMVASGELRAYLLQNVGIGTVQLAAFCDVGTVAARADALFSQTTISVGPALRYVTPVGPVSLAYGKAVLLPAALRAAPSAAPRHGRVHFTFGYTF